VNSQGATIEGTEAMRGDDKADEKVAENGIKSPGKKRAFWRILGRKNRVVVQQEKSSTSALRNEK